MQKKQYSSRMIMMISIAVGIVLAVIIWPLSMIGKGGAPTAVGGDAAELRIQPVARVEMQQAVAPSAQSAQSDGPPRDGETVYNTICSVCHATGVAGAPKAGDKAAWAPRIANGLEALIKSATVGKGAMPPKGGASDLTDAELAAAVEHLVNLSK
ncbi:MAG: c-type cytochrome [Propionivibrio sp.]